MENVLGKARPRQKFKWDLHEMTNGRGQDFWFVYDPAVPGPPSVRTTPSRSLPCLGCLPEGEADLTMCKCLLFA